jgi:adenylate cyclase
VFFDHERLGGAEEAARAAFQTGVEIRQALARTALPTAIGIGGGPVIAGILGARGIRLDYTVIGDPVNLASRLAAMAHGLEEPRLVLAESVRSLLGDATAFRDLGEVTVKGKARSIRVFQLLQTPESPTA